MKRIVRIILNLIGLGFKSEYIKLANDSIVITKELIKMQNIILNIQNSKIVSELSLKDYTAIFNPILKDK